MTATHVHPVYGARNINDIRRDLTEASARLRQAKFVGRSVGIEVLRVRIDRLLDQLLDARGVV